MPPKIPPKKPAIAQPKEQARVLFSYTAENDDELTIKEGDIINIIDKEIEDKGWMKGELNGKIGVFPDNFIALISPSVPASKPVTVGNNFKSVSNSFHSSNNSLNNGNSADDSPPKLPVKKPNAETKLSKISSKFGDSIREMIISKSNNSLNETPIAGPLFLQKQQPPNSSDDPIKASPAGHHPAAAAPAANSSAPSLPLKKSKLFATTTVPKPPFSKDEDSAGETTANESSISKSADTSDLSSSMSSFIDEHNNSIKLTHLTKHRVQGPPRRPPSIIQINSKDDESFDGLDSGPLSEAGKTDSVDNLDLDAASITAGQKPAAKTDAGGLNRQSFKCAASSPAGEMSSVISTPAKATTPTNQPPPWMVELKKTQAEKKNEVSKMKKNFSFDEGTADRSLLASASVAPSPVVGQPTAAPVSNSFNGTSPSSSKKALQMPNSPTKLGPAAPSAATSHRMSGDYSQRFKDFLQQNSTPATNSLSRHSSVNNHSFNSARTLSTDSLTNNNDSKEPPPSMLGFGNLASPFASVVKPVKAAKPTTAPKFVSSSPTATSNSAGNLLSSNLGNDRHAHQTAAAGKDGVSRKEFDELQKKVNDLTETVETQKQTYKGLIKDLINDLAEEKKKVANLTIEVDRLRKLTTTV